MPRGGRVDAVAGDPCRSRPREGAADPDHRGGLRGGLSVAMALSLPATAPRELLVGITYVIVVFSIIGQGLTIGPLVRWLGVAGAPKKA